VHELAGDVLRAIVSNTLPVSSPGTARLRAGPVRVGAEDRGRRSGAALAPVEHAVVVGSTITSGADARRVHEVVNGSGRAARRAMKAGAPST